MTEPEQRPENEAFLKAQNKAIDDAIEGRELPEKVGTAQETATTANDRSVRAMQQIGTVRERLTALEEFMPSVPTSEAMAAALAGMATHAEMDAVRQALPGYATLTAMNAAFAAFREQLLGGEVDAALDTIREIGIELKNNAKGLAAFSSLLASKQDLDATLTALAAIVGTAGGVIYSTGNDQFAQAPSVPYGRSLLNVADAASLRTMIGAMKMEWVAGVTTALGVGTIVFANVYAEAPMVEASPIWSGASQMVIGQVTATTLKGATCAVKRSRGTLLLTTGPFEDAPIGTPFRMLVIGR